ncbi:YfcC family protein [Lutibacter sp.]|uniref:YfcC family protein n=1 Tax=Lutibacter sp. TaxID=1925666 RepID=UPI003565FB17
MKKTLKFPSPYSVLFIAIILSAIATWFLPAGHYNTLLYESSTNEFIISSGENEERVVASQELLDAYNIAISLDKFEEGKIKKPISIPGTYSKVDAKPQGFFEILFAPIKGIYEAIDIILFVLIIGGFIGVFNSSGAFNDGVGFLAHRLNGKENILIIIVTTLIAIGGTTFGLAEETLAFYPILVPVFLAAGYDLIVPVAVIYIGSSIGSMASTVNPFSTIIASDAAGVNWTVGIYSRLALLVLGLAVCIWFVIRYANKIKKDPTKSLLYNTKLSSPFDSNLKVLPQSSLKSITKVLLSLFACTFIVMIYGVSVLGWWFEEMTALFLVAAILIGILQRVGEQNFIKEFINGAKDLLGVSFIIGIARGVTFVLNEGQISDTILFYATNIVEGMPPALFLPILMMVFFVLTLFISSSSGLALVTMPIMSSLAPVVGVPPEEIVNTYLFGMGLMSFITPTGLILPSLAMVNVNYNIWLKFIWPLMLILAILSFIILWGGLLF